MKILLASDTYPPDVNGASRFTERLAHGLADRGHEVHVAAPSPTGPAGEESMGPITVHRVQSYRWPFHEWYRVCLPWTAKPQTAELVDRIKPDIVHSQAHFIVGRYAIAAASRQGYPLVATTHFMPENLFMHAKTPAFLEEFVRIAAWKDLERVFAPALHITSPTPRAIELLEARTKLTGEALSNGIDPTSYRRAAEKGESEIPTVLFVGRLDQEKRVDELIKAFAQLSPDVPARLEIVGDGSCREEWKTLAQQVGLTADRVTFRGYISEEELVEAYGRCAIFCMPGIAELQSLVTLEAMAAGKPVVCADAMALPHLCRPGQNGWLYEPGDVGELTLRLSTLLGDKAMRARFGQHSQQIANRHSMADTLDRFEEIYADALGLSDFAEDTEAAA